jgi:hypothetical protein
LAEVKIVMIVVQQLENLRVNKRGVVWGGVCLHHSGLYFPQESWDDIVDGVFSLWLSATHDIVVNGKRKGVLRFCDGDWNVKIELHGDGAVSTLWKDDKRIIEDKWHREIDIAEFAQSLCREYTLFEAALSQKFPAKADARRGIFDTEIQQILKALR